ncbi:MAG: class I SAM-dependent methyltransferase [Spirochaetales bacterium]|nr:class I SAM-dependent methyltransferase [Spirochaetales bacterium]
MGENYFGEEIAADYDRTLGEHSDPSWITSCVEVLEEYAGKGKALEFGIGTGRIALPLSMRGVLVEGMDLSPQMLAQLKKKPGSEEIPVREGDFSRDRMDGTYTLVYLVFNTIMNLTSQETQTECFINAARHLNRGGYFLIETMVPDLRRLPPGETVRPFGTDNQLEGFDEYDTVSQKLVSHHLEGTGENRKIHSIPFRYVWPSELDLMARIAGMSLTARWENWEKAPFTHESRSHISLWQKSFS